MKRKKLFVQGGAGTTLWLLFTQRMIYIDQHMTLPNGKLTKTATKDFFNTGFIGDKKKIKGVIGDA